MHMSEEECLNEQERLSALHRYSILDTPHEAIFDDLTKLAAGICETPVALISLVDEERQWFKSVVGVQLCETPRDISFCHHTIKTGEVFEVRDTSKDERFRGNPLVTGEPHIRFYAGAPLVTPDGYRLGALCVIDHVPRELSESQRDSLKRLARQVVGHLESHADRLLISKAKEKLQEGNERTEQILASARDAVVTMSVDGLIVSWNPQAEVVFGWDATEVIGRKMSDLIIPPAHRKAHEKGLRHFMETGEAPVLDQRLELTALRKNGEEFPVELTVSRIQVSGKPFFSGFMRDLSAAKDSEMRLQRTSDLLSAVGHLQSRYISGDKTGATRTFDALLELLLKFTESEYGFVAEVLRDEDGQPYLKTHAITNIAWNEEMRAFYDKHKAAGLEFRNLKTLFGAALVTGEPVITNSPATDPRRGGLPPGHPPMNSFLGVPIKQGGELIAMVGAANRPGGYDQSVVEEIEPLLSTYATLIRGIQFKKQQQEDQQRIEKLNSVLEVRASELSEALKENRRVERERREALEDHSANLERRVAERTTELEHSQRQFKDLFNEAPDALVMMDQSGAIKLVNRQAERMFGWSRDELVGMNIEAVLPSSPGNGIFKGGEARPEDGGKASLPGRRKDGTEFPLEISMSPVQTGDSQLTTVAMRDLSERMKLEQEVARISSHEQERLAHELHDHLGAYLAGVAFRLKTMGESLDRRSTPEASDAQELVGQVNEGIDLVRNFARLLAPVDLATGGLAAGLTELAREMEKTFELTCQVKLPAELPLLTQEQSMQLYRVAQEAIRNAIQHGRARLVTIAIGQKDSNLIMTISNDGEPLRDDGGPARGLGLRIMRHRAAGLGGTFTIVRNADGITEAACVVPMSTDPQVSTETNS